MQQHSQLKDRINGCLTGAVIGAELGFSELARPDKFQVNNPEDIFNIKLNRVTDYKEDRNRTTIGNTLHFLRIGIEVYLKKKGRAMPEDFAEILKDDKEISKGVFIWDGIHTIQEILKEGMHPRLSGLGATPSGFVCASMVGVGTYHGGDPEYAYIDGVEIASVVQPRLGADRAGLCGAAIASSFIPGIKPSEVKETVMKIAFQNNKDLFYQYDYFLKENRKFFNKGKEEFLRWWFYSGGHIDWNKFGRWFAPDPLYHILPLLEFWGEDANKIMALLLVPANNSSFVSPVIAGAILGAIYGKEIFPEEWLDWAEPITSNWVSLGNIVEKRLKKERDIIQITEKLSRKQEDGDSTLFDKIYGCLLASSIGNAMGSPVEGMFYWEIDKKYKGGIKTILNPERLEGEDDNQMAMLLVETYIEREGQPVTARHFGDMWKRRLNEYHFYPHCMGSAYQMIMEGWDPRIVGHWKPVTGSTVMCMEPVGIYHLLDEEFAMIDAIEISYMYQRGLDVIVASLLAVAVSEAFRPAADVESICKKVLSCAPKGRLKTFDRRPFKSCYEYLETCLEIADRYGDVFKVRVPLYERCLLYSAIDPLEVLGLSLAIFKTAKGDVRKSAIGGTNIGRDSDTIAGRAAMLSGVLRGAKNVPSEWLTLFKPEPIERIKRNAERLVNLIVNNKLEKMKKRQNLWDS